MLLLRAALNPFSAQLLFVLGIELHEDFMGPPLKPVEVPLVRILALQHVDHTTQLGVLGKFAEGAFNPTVHIVDKDITWHQYQH